MALRLVPQSSWTARKVFPEVPVPPSARLVSVATAVPPHGLRQTDVADYARACFAGRYHDFDRLSQVFATSGVRKRYAVRPMEWYAGPIGWPERTAAYHQGAEALFVECAGKALSSAGLKAGQIDSVVTVSSTGIATPSLEARLLGRMGFRQNVTRVPVFGLGCAGGATGLAIAARLARAQPGSCVLLVVVELCTLAVRMDLLTKANVVATALFGDGAAACVLRAGTAGLGTRGLATIEAAGEHTWPETIDMMGWRMDPQGFGVIFAQAIPSFVTENLRSALGAMAAGWGHDLAGFDRFICHPGGAKVIAALETALSLNQGALDLEREVLADYGNMSAPTVLFVLERAVARGLPKRSLVNAMGPGFTTSCLMLSAP